MRLLFHHLTTQYRAMAKNDNVKDFCKDVADAIRAKKGTTDLINPQDFSKEIASIEGGGSGGGESNIEYLDVRGLDVESKLQFIVLSALLMRTVINGVVLVTPSLALYLEVGNEIFEKAEAIMIDRNSRLIAPDTNISFEELLTEYGADSLPRLTKEQFYSLE